MPDLIHIAEKTATLLGQMKDLARLRQGMSRYLSSMVKQGAAEHITSLHPDQKLASLGKAFEEMLNHDVARRFLRRKPKLYLLKDMPGALNLPSPGYMAKHIAIPESAVKLLSPAELKGMLGHEIGHILRQDSHFRREMPGLAAVGREAEKMADQLGVILSGEAEATKSGLKKLMNATRKSFLAAGDKENASLVQSVAVHGTPEYPSVKERLGTISDTAAKMKENGSFVREEMARRLEAEHRKLFPHHYNRPGGVTRSQ